MLPSSWGKYFYIMYKTMHIESYTHSLIFSFSGVSFFGTGRMSAVLYRSSIVPLLQEMEENINSIAQTFTTSL